jgi:hypothetical protein
MGDLVSSQGVTFSWKDVDFTATSIQYKMDAAAEYDMTSMSSPVVSLDTANTNAVRVVKSYDYAVVDRGEVTMDFFANTNCFSLTAAVGHDGTLTLRQTEPDTSNPFYSQLGGQVTVFEITSNAFLTSFSFAAQVGSYITGNCTFKLSGD